MNLIECIVDPFIETGKLIFKLVGESIFGNEKREFDFEELFKSTGLKNSEGKYPSEDEKPYKGKDGYREFYFKTPTGLTLSDISKKKGNYSVKLNYNINF